MDNSGHTIELSVLSQTDEVLATKKFEVQPVSGSQN
jgi:hypothetical protein